MPKLSLMDVILRLILSGILGAVIGLEREMKGHSAGLRTNILVSTSASLLMLMAIHLHEVDNVSGDFGAVAATMIAFVVLFFLKIVEP